MLDVNTLPKSYRKVEEFENDVGQMDVDRKRTEEGRQKYFKTKCVRRWRVTWCSVSLLLTFIPI